MFSEVKPLVSSFLDGFNTCVLAYGQTGSGKTHTMFGPPAESGLPEMSGIIPRVIAEVFELKEAQRAMATVSIEITVLEVYNEAVRDLLSEKPWAKHEVTDSGSGAEVLTAEKVAVDCEVTSPPSSCFSSSPILAVHECSLRCTLITQQFKRGSHIILTYSSCRPMCRGWLPTGWRTGWSERPISMTTHHDRISS